MIEFNQVGEFVDHHVIDQPLRALDQSPAEIEISTPGTGAPAPECAADADFSRRKLKFSGEFRHPAGQMFGGEPAVETLQPFADLLLAAMRNQKLPAVESGGLSGEVRPAPRTYQRILEAARLGFNRIVVSAYYKDQAALPKGIRVVKVGRIDQLGKAIFIFEE